MKTESDIDIVLPWVDGADPEWRRAFAEAHREFRGDSRGTDSRGTDSRGTDSRGTDSRGAESRDGSRGIDISAPVVATGGDENAHEIRYRDWGTLPYVFRGIERFAPWVRRVHLVTCGHLPTWLNTNCERLNVVRHSEFIPPDYLPTFASRPIELNAHRISGLSEKFVLFNDDMFLLRPVAESRFFRDKLPCDMARLSLIGPSTISHTVLNMVEIMARRHDRRTVMRGNRAKWFSPRYGVDNLLKTLNLSLWQGWSGLADTHMPQPYLRATFERMWAEERAILDATCRQKFRSPFGVNHWLMRYEQLATGMFAPVGFGDAHLDALCEGRMDEIERVIRSGNKAMICLNDSPLTVDFEALRTRLHTALEAILPEKSSYEL